EGGSSIVPRSVYLLQKTHLPAGRCGRRGGSEAFVRVARGSRHRIRMGVVLPLRRLLLQRLLPLRPPAAHQLAHLVRAAEVVEDGVEDRRREKSQYQREGLAA